MTNNSALSFFIHKTVMLWKVKEKILWQMDPQVGQHIIHSSVDHNWTTVK